MCLYILNDNQLAQFVALSKEESSLSDQYALMRFPLMTAFRDQFAGTIPAGSSGLDKAAVMAYSGSCMMLTRASASPGQRPMPA